ncbi:PQQ-binding-like beta-propeller repeat protein [Candidatus Poribacteria bacterium]|nr:PQQ-binding-like beta-propeller repeat protein [Candidatus Poribacteria bacterium]
MWTRGFIRIAFIFIVAGTAWAREPGWRLETWIPLDGGMTMSYVWVLEGQGHRLYAGTSENGLFISEDDGRTWLPTSFNQSTTTLTINGDTVYAGTWSRGIFRSDDAGVTWKPIRDGLRFQDLDGDLFYWEVRRILIMDDKIINVMYHGGTYTSTDRGETWHDISKEWLGGNSIYSMTAFGGYLWSAISIGQMLRSPDKGQTWGQIAHFDRGRVNDWAVVDGRLYLAGEQGVGRWNETIQTWEYPMNELPTGRFQNPNDPPFLYSFAVVGGYLFAGLDDHGVYAFDSQSETWSSVGLEGLSVYSLLSHGAALYAGTKDDIYRADIQVLPSVQPRGKAVTTWARVKRDALAP